MKNNTEEKTPHQVLLENLNNPKFAVEFYNQKKAQAEELLAQVFMVTNGSSDCSDADFGQKNIHQIFEMFLISHKNFNASLLMEELQRFIFTWTLSHSKAYSNWYKELDNEIYAFRNSEVTEETSELETAAPIESDSDKRDKFFFQIWANKIAHVLESKDVSEDTKNAIKGVLTAIANESNGGLYDEPDVVRVGFPLQMQMLNFAERRAFKLAIDNIFDCSLDSAVLDELEQYDISFALQENEESAPLDLSALSADELNSNDTKDNKHFAKCLADILNDSNFPDELRNGIMNGIDETICHAINDTTEFYKYERTPEYIQKVLDLSRGAK